MIHIDLSATVIFINIAGDPHSLAHQSPFVIVIIIIIIDIDTDLSGAVLQPVEIVIAGTAGNFPFQRDARIVAQLFCLLDRGHIARQCVPGKHAACDKHNPG
jgi:hypothetical protein